jgi:hypothetical protein
MSRSTPDKPDQAPQQPPSQETQQTALAAPQMTKRQIGCLNRQLRERGLSQAETEAWLCQAANIDTMSELTKRQASVLIECLFRVTEPIPVRQESEVRHD